VLRARGAPPRPNWWWCEGGTRALCRAPHRWLGRFDAPALTDLVALHLPPQALPAEYSLAPDAPQIAFRALRHDWARAGFVAPPESPRRPRRGLLDEAPGGAGGGGGGCGGGGW
jgi:hypothetical protein